MASHRRAFLQQFNPLVNGHRAENGHAQMVLACESLGDDDPRQASILMLSSDQAGPRIIARHPRPGVG
jgi:hypothetical protein